MSFPEDMFEAGIAKRGLPTNDETPADAYNNRALGTEQFEAAWGRAVRDIYTSDVDIIKAMYDACVIGWEAGYEYGQQS